MVLKLVIERAANNTTCATSGTPLRAGADVVRVLSTCGSQHDVDTSATMVASHDPKAFLSKLSVTLMADLPTSDEKGSPSTAVHGATQVAQRHRHCSGGAAAAAVQPQPVCALTGAVLQPGDVVLLLPPTAVPRPSGSPPLALTLAGGAQLLEPLLRAVGRTVAAKALEAMPGLKDLGDRQRIETCTRLQAAAAAAEAEAAGPPGDNRAETDSEGNGGRGVAAAAAAAAAIDAAVRLDDDVQRAKRRRIARPQALPTVDGEDGDGGGEADADTSARGAEETGSAAVAAAAAPRATARPPLTRCRTRAAAHGAAGAPTHRGGGKALKAPKSPAAATTAGAGGGAEKGGAAATDAAGPVAPKTADPWVDLDRERAELMERNRRKLLELQLPGLVSGLTAPGGHGSGGVAAGRQQASHRGIGAKRHRDGFQEPPPPLRMSLRQRGVAADSALSAGIEHETSTGVQLVAGRQAVEAVTGRAAGESGSPEKARHPKGELPFRSDNGDKATDAAFLAVLKAAAAAAATTTAAADGSEEDSSARRSSSGIRPCGEVLAGLHLADRDVAKVTKDGVTHLAWLPGCERLLLAAADKAGKVSLWDVDVEESGPAADTDGVLMFSPHAEYISGMRWLGREAAIGPCRLITAAYDGSLRALDLGGSGTWLELPAPGDPGVSEFSSLEVSSDGRTAYLGDPLGNLDIVDLRAPPPSPSPSSLQKPHQPQAQQRTTAVGRTNATAGGGNNDGSGGGGAEGARVAAEGALNGELAAATAASAAASAAAAVAAVGPLGGLQICARKINSLHLEPSGENLLASSCSDGTVCIWDVRKLDTAVVGAHRPHKSGGSASASASSTHQKSFKPLSVLHHGKSCHSAYWAQDGSRRLLSTSYDDTIRIWSARADDGAHFKQEQSIPHNNQTGRWITPFRAVWSAACDAVLVGNMRRGLDVFGGLASTAVGSTAAADALEGEDPKSVLQGSRKTAAGKGAAAAGAGKAAAKGKAGGAGGGGAGPGQLLRTLVSEHMTAIPSRAACHPILPVVVAATSSGRCHVWR